jgi:hypothetical protein
MLNSKAGENQPEREKQSIPEGRPACRNFRGKSFICLDKRKICRIVIVLRKDTGDLNLPAK